MNSAFHSCWDIFNTAKRLMIGNRGSLFSGSQGDSAWNARSAGLESRASRGDQRRWSASQDWPGWSKPRCEGRSPRSRLAIRETIRSRRSCSGSSGRRSERPLRNPRDPQSRRERAGPAAAHYRQGGPSNLSPIDRRNASGGSLEFKLRANAIANPSSIASAYRREFQSQGRRVLWRLGRQAGAAAREIEKNARDMAKLVLIRLEPNEVALAQALISTRTLSKNRDAQSHLAERGLGRETHERPPLEPTRPLDSAGLCPGGSR